MNSRPRTLAVFLLLCGSIIAATAAVAAEPTHCLKSAYKEFIDERAPIPESVLKRVKEQTYLADQLRLAAKMEKRASESLPYFGIKDWEVFLGQLISHPDPKVRQAYQWLEDGRIQVASFQPEFNRVRIAKTGAIINGTWIGSARSQRAHVEQSFAGTEIPQDNLPVYGMLRPGPETGLRYESIENSYGEDGWIINAEKVADRMTFTFGDSLSRSKRGQTDAWDLKFIPWKYRALLIPYWEQSIKSEGTLTGPGVEYSGQTLPGGIKLSVTGRGSTEIQIFGPIYLDDFKGFEFRKNPPEGEFLEILQRHRIKIYDGRGINYYEPEKSIPPILWEPSVKK